MPRFLALLGTVFQIAALVFLILATLSSPVTRTFSLANDSQFTYGVFGYCSVATSTNAVSCSKAAASYRPSQLGTTSDWLFKSGARDTLAKMLIVTPIAAGMTLFSMLWNTICVFSGATKGSGAWIVGLILAVLVTVSTIFATLVVVFLFHPHLTWSGWILIGCSVLNILAIIIFALFAFPREDDNDNESLGDLTPLGKTEPDYVFSSGPDTGYQANNFPPPKPYSPLSGEAKEDAYDVDTSRMDTNSTYVSNKSVGGSQHAEKPAVPATASVDHSAYSQSEAQFGFLNHPDPPSQPPVSRGLDQFGDYNAIGTPTNAVGSFEDEERDHRLPITSHTTDSTDSDFTSISQRAINPRYYRGGQQAPPQILERPAYGYQPQSAPPPNFQQGYGPPQSQQYSRTQQQSPRHKQPTISDVVLNNNPDFNIGGVTGRKSKPAPLSHPQNRQRMRDSIPAASAISDGPYRSFN